jgi:hypothetical protein
LKVRDKWFRAPPRTPLSDGGGKRTTDFDGTGAFIAVVLLLSFHLSCLKKQDGRLLFITIDPHTFEKA